MRPDGALKRLKERSAGAVKCVSMYIRGSCKILESHSPLVR